MELLRSDSPYMEAGYYGIIKYDKNGNAISNISYNSDNSVDRSTKWTYDSDNNVVSSELTKTYGVYKWEYFYNSDGLLSYEIAYEDDIFEERVEYTYQDGIKKQVNVYSDELSTDLKMTVDYSYDNGLISKVEVYDVYGSSKYLENTITIQYSGGKIISTTDDYETKTFTYNDDKLTQSKTTSEDSITIKDFIYSGKKVEKIITENQDTIDLTSSTMIMKFYYQSGEDNSNSLQYNEIYDDLSYYYYQKVTVNRLQTSPAPAI